MDKRKILKRIETLYKTKNQNVMQYLKEISHQGENNLEDIMIAYDFQAGTYTKQYEEIPHHYEAFVARLADVVNRLDCRKNSIFECGIGEAMILVNLCNKLKEVPDFLGGVDISWSRVKQAQNVVSKYLRRGTASLMVGDMFNLPLMDNSIDIVYTFQAVEPNGGHEREILKELWRVTNEYLILVEPSYENASEEGKRRMEMHGYVRNLYRIAKELNFDILTWEPYRTSGDEENPLYNDLNPLYIMVVRKDAGKDIQNPLCCPLTKTPLEKIGNAYFSKESLLAYPIMNDVPCLIESSAMVATKMDSWSGSVGGCET
jgi:uncharacterized protein YbaR (Trm112 family)